MNENTANQCKLFIKLKSESGSENVHYSLLYEDLPEEFKMIAKQELNETEEKRQEGMRKLKELSKRENLPYVGDHLLLALLRSCKYNLKKSETKLKKCLIKRREVIDMLAKMGMEKIETIIDDMPFGFLPYRDKHGRIIVYTRPYGVNLERYEIFDAGTVLTAAGYFLLHYPITTVTGFSYFGECKAPSLYIFYPIFKTIRRFLPHLLSFPVRIARMEILNENHLVRWFAKLMSPLVSKKIENRVSFHGHGYDSLHKLYDPNILPEDFGGNLGPLDNIVYKEKLLAFIKELMKENY